MGTFPGRLMKYSENSYPEGTWNLGQPNVCNKNILLFFVVVAKFPDMFLPDLRCLAEEDDMTCADSRKKTSESVGLWREMRKRRLTETPSLLVGLCPA